MDLAGALREVFAGDHLVQRRIQEAGLHAGVQREWFLAGGGHEVDLVAVVGEHVVGADEFFAQ